MAIDPYRPNQDQSPHSPLSAKPDPLGPGQVDTQPGIERRSPKRE